MTPPTSVSAGKKKAGFWERLLNVRRKVVLMPTASPDTLIQSVRDGIARGELGYHLPKACRCGLHQLLDALETLRG